MFLNTLSVANSCSMLTIAIEPYESIVLKSKLLFKTCNNMNDKDYDSWIIFLAFVVVVGSLLAAVALSWPTDTYEIMCSCKPL